MRQPRELLFALAIFLSVQGCGQSPRSPAPKAVRNQDEAAQALNQFDAETRIAAANKRIDELERKIGALESTPEKLDLDLLTQRVTALEVKASGGGAAVLQGTPTADSSRSNGRKSLANGKIRRPPSGSARLNLPELENRPRLATPAEAKAFSPGK